MEFPKYLRICGIHVRCHAHEYDREHHGRTIYVDPEYHDYSVHHGNHAIHDDYESHDNRGNHDDFENESHDDYESERYDESESCDGYVNVLAHESPLKDVDLNITLT